MKKIVSFICSIVLMMALISNIQMKEIFAVTTNNLIIAKGQTYEIRIPSDTVSAVTNINVSSEVQVAVYNGTEQIYSCYTKDIQGVYRALRYRGTTMKITAINDSVIVKFPQGSSIKLVDEPVFKNEIKLSYGESYEFVNKAAEDVVLGVDREYINDDKAIDIGAYSKNYSLVSICEDYQQSINCYSDCTTKITCKEKDGVTIYIPEEFEGTINKIYTPALYYKNIELNKVYDFTNNTEKIFKVLTDSEEDFEGTIYEKHRGLVTTFKTNSFFRLEDGHGCNDRYFQPGDGFRITNKEGEAFNIIVPYECKDSIVEVENAPEVLEKITLTKGQTLEVDSKEEGLNLITSGLYYGNDIRFNAIRYEESSSYIKNVFYGYDYARLNKKGAMELESGESIDVYVPYEYMKYCKVLDRPLFKEIVVNPGEKYEFKNPIESTEVTFYIKFKDLAYAEKGVNLYGENDKGDITLFLEDVSSDARVESGNTVTIELLSEGSKTLCVPYIYGDYVKKVDFYKEDVNEDNVITLEDLSIVAGKLGTLLENEEVSDSQVSKCDINKDGVVDLKDIVRVARRVK